MIDFYMQLISNASRLEFSSNSPHHFKNHMPYPLQFKEWGWKVGVSSLLLPETPRKIKLNDSFLSHIEWLELADPQAGFYAEERVDVMETDFQGPPKTGTEFFNAVRDRYLRDLNDQPVSDLQFHKEDDPTQWTYMTMNYANEGKGTIDNTRTCTSIQINNSPCYPKLFIGIELAKSMQWVTMGTLQIGRPGYVLGPNLRKEFPTHIVMAAVDVLTPVNNGDEIFYKVMPDTLQLSAFINWVFMDLDRSYERVFGNNHRPVHLYSNAMRSMVVGNQVTDLMREIPYSMDERHCTKENVDCEIHLCKF